MFQNIFVVGATGNVGRELVSQVISKGDMDPLQHDSPTRIVGLASSSKFIFSPEGLPSEACLDFSKRQGSNGSPQDYRKLDELLDHAVTSGYGTRKQMVFVDATSADTLEFHMSVMAIRNLGMVTANKIPLANATYADFQSLTKEVRKYGFRTTVMAGADLVNMLQDSRDVKDGVVSVSGSFSGTLGYLCTELENGKPLSDAVRGAKEKKYTEPHPRDDLSGMDVARKLLIIARTAGFEVSIADIDRKPFIEEGYLQVDDVGKFLDGLKPLDEPYAKKVQDAASRNMALRYVARIQIVNDHPLLSASLKEVPREGVIGSLKGTKNAFELETSAYPREETYSIVAPGAGVQRTAQNLRRDLLYMLSERKFKT